MPEIIDSPWRMTPHLSALSAAGCKTVVRYINHHNSTKLPEKCIEPAEAKAIHGAGMTIALVFEQKQDNSSAFTAVEGKKAAQRAYDYSTNSIGRPSGSPIYFAVDFDAVGSAPLNAVEDYFKAVNADLSAQATATPVGVYGSGTVCQFLRDADLASFFWLAQSTGWSGYHAFVAGKHWNLLQGFRKKGTGLNFDYDPNFANVTIGNVGAF